MRRLAVILGSLFGMFLDLALATAAAAAPRSIDDCEAIKEPLAYNACLASFGPKRGERSAPAYHGDPEASAPRGAGGARYRAPHRVLRVGGAPVSRSRNGRVHMEFTPRHGG